MKIKIIYNFTDKPTGGTNQFLKALKKNLILSNSYTEIDKEADVFLFIAHKWMIKVIFLKLIYSKKVFVHRLDGPIRLYAKKTDKRDYIINISNKLIADATIFQTNWSRKNNYNLGLEQKEHETTIINAPDNTIFNRKDKVSFSETRKVKIILSSWSPWYKKGFAVYKWLDETLDFEKYEVTFCGNSPIEFKNIKHVAGLPSVELAKLLKQNDIYLTASQKDPCSNSLIEALHCGLPALALSDGGHPEIVNQGGELFTNKYEISVLLKKIVLNYDFYQKRIQVPDIKNVLSEYIAFIKEIYLKNKSSEMQTKKLTIWGVSLILKELYIFKLSSFVLKFYSRIKY